MKKCTFVSMVVLSLFAFSCKKDAGPSTQEKLLGKWNMVSAPWNSHVNGTDHKDSTSFSAGEAWLEFKKDGTIISYTSYSLDTLPYKILDAQQLLIVHNDTVSIHTLNNSDLHLYYRKIKNTTGDFFEEWDHFKR